MFFNSFAGHYSWIILPILALCIVFAWARDRKNGRK